MKKSEMFDILVREVCRQCEVSFDAVIGESKLQGAVDARTLCVQYLRRIGLSNDDIAVIVLRWAGVANPTIEEIRRKSKTIQKKFDAYSQRCLESYAFCLLSADIKKFCREKYAELFSFGMKELPSR